MNTLTDVLLIRTNSQGILFSSALTGTVHHDPAGAGSDTVGGWPDAYITLVQVSRLEPGIFMSPT